MQVVRGDPSPEEVAALVAVLTARARAAAARDGGEPRTSRWPASAATARARATRPGCVRSPVLWGVLIPGRGMGSGDT
nr:acyl-CoA carboxylase subunit epsilon [Actinomadura sp. RB99]